MIAPLTILRRPVKHARLRIREDSSVQLIVPEGFDQSLIDSLLIKKAAWIARNQKYFRDRVLTRRTLAANEILLRGEVYRFVRCPELGRKVAVDDNTHEIKTRRDLASRAKLARWLRVYAHVQLNARLMELSEEHHLPFKRCFIRSQRTRWGTCSTKGNISLNWRLIMAPPYVTDYVILHELMHTKVLNHSQKFWVLLRSICPGCQEAIQWLNANPPSELAGWI